MARDDEVARLVDQAGREVQAVRDLQRAIDVVFEVWAAQAALGGLSAEDLRVAVGTRVEPQRNG